MPIRDSLSGRLAARLGRLDPRARPGEPIPVRAEFISGREALSERATWWRALTGAADPANPALDPDAVVPALESEPAARAPGFLCLWREAAARAGFQERELVGLLPFARARARTVALPWAASWAPAWSPTVTPLIHRRYQEAAARALLGWLGERPAPFAALVLGDLAASGGFAKTLLAAPAARARDRGRAIARLDAPFAAMPPPEDIVLRAGRALTGQALEAALALAGLWSGAIGDNGVLAADGLSMAWFAYLSAAARQGRAAVAEVTRGGHVIAIALAVRTGSTARLLAAAANPRLGAGEAGRARARAVGALVDGLGLDARIAAIEAGPGMADIAACLLTKRLGLTDVTLGAPGPFGRAARAASRLVGA